MKRIKNVKRLLFILATPFFIVLLYWLYCIVAIVASYIKFQYLFDKEEAERIVQLEEADIAACQRYCAHVLRDVDYDAVSKEQPYRSSWLYISGVDSVCLRSLEKELNIDIRGVEYNGKGVMINLKYNYRTFLKEDTESFIHSVWYNVENDDVFRECADYYFHRIKYEKTLSDSLRYVYHTNEWVENR